MTPEELRRQARQKRTEADEMAADGERLLLQAAALQGLLDPLGRISQQVWIGPAATDFELKVRSHGNTVDAQAAKLRVIAGELGQRAASNRRVAAIFDAEAAAAEAAAAATSVSSGAVPGGVI